MQRIIAGVPKNVRVVAAGPYLGTNNAPAAGTDGVSRLQAVDGTPLLIPISPIIVLSNVSTDVIPDMTGYKEELAGRFLQNVGNNAAFYAFGQDCTAQAYHGQLAVGQQLDCTNNAQRVSVFITAAGGGTFAITIHRMADLDTQIEIQAQAGGGWS